ncbi:glycoside hydrolase family 25 protein [Acidiluteibacter ferrifornacis]|uniref:Glycoside hydrolase family 25 protein n=1 Tax=Acidiluteibacter ferrifornacis TaxID=2692424 RepID=A0A6N9NKH5_9FLAO|nr:glycoside hydrolase family 25 protein [Acidiluteibacter ferrifornacis]NBG65700.1 glycoside hydrolase family 25 protein [Acidiluteibacter ferrifornacis]
MKNRNTLIHSIVVIAAILLSSCSTGEAPVKELAPSKAETKEIAALDSTPVAVKQALGIDVSHFQGAVDWDEIKANNITFAYTKATQGATYIDSKFHQNWSEMAAANIARGAYHFYSTESDGNTQAEHFINTIKEVKAGEMPPVLDLEQGSIKGTIAMNQFHLEVLSWLTIVEAKLGVKPIIYTNNPFANQYLINEKFADYSLWIAEYGVAEAKTPLTWKDKGWSIWQRTERGNIEGEIGNVDHDITNVALHTLQIK